MRIIPFLVVLFSCVSYNGCNNPFAGGQRAFLSDILTKMFHKEGMKHSASPTSGPHVNSTHKHKLMRKVIKVVTTTEEDEQDCKSRGGTPCVRDDQCCLGRCSPHGFCPTAQELFDAAALTLKQEREKAKAAAVDKLTDKKENKHPSSASAHREHHPRRKWMGKQPQTGPEGKMYGHKVKATDDGSQTQKHGKPAHAPHKRIWLATMA